MVFLPNANPPSLVSALLQDRLLFLCTSSTDIAPLQVIEFLNGLADALEEFLGGPLLAAKIEGSYDVVAQIVDEICDAGLICNTELNSLQEAVETPSWVGSILGGFGLPAASPSLPNRSQSPSLPGLGPQSFRSGNISSTNTGTAIPWRKSNVRHTSNELYVDIVEKLSVTLAPSGRPLAAIANGVVVFTAKISGVPDLVLSLSAPGGRAGIDHALSLPTFHPCVRLARWTEKPGELSFIPPDGRFVLAGYECDLLADMFTADTSSESLSSPNLKLPATLEMSTGIGALGDEVEVRLLLPLKSSAGGAGGGPIARSAAAERLRASSPGFGASTKAAPSGPAVEDIVITVTLPPGVRNVTDLRPARGEVNFLPSDAVVEWRVPTREAATISSLGATLRFTVVGPLDESDQAEKHGGGRGLMTDTFDYTDDVDEPTDAAADPLNMPKQEDTRQQQLGRNQALMPRSASISFNVKGWLASGVRVDGLNINTRSSRRLGAGVTPYKGVKYHTLSRQGIEVRC